MADRRLLLAVCVAIAAGGGGTRAQERPNFTGRWLLDPLAQATTVTREYVVKQADGTFRVGHDDDQHALSYTLDGQEHELALHVTTIHGTRSVGKATWDGDNLVLVRTDKYQSGLTRTLKQIWSMDTPERLIVESSNVTSTGESTNTKGVYRRFSPRH
jgi:hypothetical protein